MEKRWKTNREKPELLIPAKDLEVLRTAVNFGADAVYIGGEAFSLRAKARNFSPEDMRAGIAYAHEHGVHVHVAANIFAHNRDLDQAAAYFTELAQMKPDAVLVADPGMFSLARQYCPHPGKQYKLRHIPLLARDGCLPCCLCKGTLPE